MSSLEMKIQKLKACPHDFMSRVVAVNSELMRGAWYAITLWGGSDKDLHNISKVMQNFLWARQKVSIKAKVNKPTLSKSKYQGGVGLLPFEEQVMSLVATYILFALSQGQHLL